VNCDFNVANGVAACQVPDGISCKEKEHAVFAGSFAQKAQSISLVG
jgi:hypothetical protein